MQRKLHHDALSRHQGYLSRSVSVEIDEVNVKALRQILENEHAPKAVTATTHPKKAGKKVPKGAACNTWAKNEW
jgi:hypothetical protein